MSIYVEARIQGGMEELWERTQTPEWHQRWDLRFTRITYLPRASNSEPLRFLYETRIGFGLAIRGMGETVGSRDGPNGERSSALRFWSDDPKSLIREGSGYWKYVPQPDGSIRFLTEYRYETRFGLPGHLLDRWVFAPLMGWATAWSFDRLRLWIEKGIDPGSSGRQSLCHALARVGVGFVFVYHGLVPKLLFHHPDELILMRPSGLPASLIRPAVDLIGVTEILLGLAILLLWRVPGLFLVTALGMVVATGGILLTAPAYFAHAFNPLTLNASVFILSVIAYLSRVDLPSAARCLRKRPEKEAIP